MRRGTLGTVLRALPAMIALSGCVAILGVDIEDYQDVDEAVCTCFGGNPAVCEVYIQEAFDELPALESAVIGCLDASDTCSDLSDCLFEGGVCGGEGADCAPRGTDSKSLYFYCCDGFTCGDGKKCRVECAALSEGCVDDGECCPGLVCSDETSLCCRPPGEECDPMDASSPCCAGQACSDTGRCAVCSPANQGCSAEEPCCPDAGTCQDVVGVGLVCLN